MAEDNIFTHWLLADYILPWVLVFVLIFAILEKSKILGEDKKQVNAIIGAVSGFILLAFPASRELVVKLIPFMVIVAVILFVFLLLYGFVSGEKKGDPLNKWVKVAIGTGIAIALTAAVLILTDSWDKFWDFLTGSSVGTSILFIIVAGGAVLAVLFGGKDKKDDD